MKNDPIRATGEAMPTITRRTLLATSAAAAMTATATTTQAAGISAEMHNLIETHRTLFAAWLETVGPREDAQDAYKAHREKLDPVIVPCLLGRNQEISHSHVREWAREDGRKSVVDAFAARRRDVEAFARLDPLLGEAMTATLRTKEAENLAIVERCYDEEEARQEAFGLTAVTNAYDAAADAADIALWELCAHRGQSLADERARAAYIFSDRRVRDIVLMDPDYSMALLQTTAAIENEEVS